MSKNSPPVKLPPEAEQFIKSFASAVHISMGEKLSEDWYFFPFYFKDNGDGTFQMVGFENLPDYVRRQIEIQRNGTRKNYEP
jgi:hypothetical protein